MRPLVAVTLTLGLTLTGSAASADDTRGVSVCGRLLQFTAATPDRPGDATVGTHRYTLAPDARYSAMGQNRLAFVVGNAICVNGGRQADGALFPYIAIGIPSPYCGMVLAYRPPTTTLKGLLTLLDTGAATFEVAAGADLSDDVGGTYHCFSLAIDAQGDAYVAGRVIRPLERVTSNFEACGRITAYDKATTATAGRIAVGTRTFVIEKAFVYTGDPAGDHTDRTAVGKDMCLRGGLASSGELVTFITSGFRDLSCGTVSAIVAATRTSSGSIAFSAGPTADYARYVIPIGKALATAVGAELCIRAAVDSDGNAFVSALAFPDRSVRVGASTGTGPLPSPSPDVALEDLPQSAPEASAAVAAETFAVEAGSEAWPLLALGALVLGSLLVIGLRRR